MALAALASALKLRSTITPEVATTRNYIIRGFIPVVAALAILQGLNALALPYTSIRLDSQRWVMLLLAGAICSAVGLYCLKFVFARALGACMIISWIVIIAGQGGLTLSYITSSLGHSFPLRDPALASIDAGLGFDWTAMLAWFDRYPTTTTIGRHFYQSLVAQQVIVPIILILFRQYRTAQMTVLIFITSLLLTHLIALFAPAVSSYPFYGIDPSQHPNARLSQEDTFIPVVHALRAGLTVDLSQPPFFAVTTFPSLHSTMAIVFAWALRQAPYVRWLGLFTNAIMLAFTPLHGSHYLVDVIAGVALALVTIPLSQWLMGKLAGPSMGADIAPCR